MRRTGGMVGGGGEMVVRLGGGGVSAKAVKL